MSTNLLSDYILPIKKTNMGDPLCTRITDEERGRWDRLCEAVKKRNSLAKQSDILRDIIFGSHNIITDSDRLFLLTGDAKLLAGGIILKPKRVKINNMLEDETKGERGA